MHLFRIGWDYLKRHKAAFFAIMVLQAFQVLLSLVLPALNAKIIDQGILGNDIPLIWRYGSIMLVFACLQIAAMAGAIYLGSKTAMRLGRELRARTFRHVQSFSATDQHTFGAPTLITRTTNDVSQVQMVILLTFTVMVMSPLMGFGGVFMAIQQDAVLSLLLVVIVPVLGLLIFFVMRALSPRYKTQQTRIDRINTLLREQLTGVRVIRAFVRQKTEEDKFTDANHRLRSIWLQIGFLWAFLMPAAFLVIGISSAAVVWFGGVRIDSGHMQVGTLTAYISYLMMIMMSVMMSGMMVMLFPRGEVSATRIDEILNTRPSIKGPDSPRMLPAEPLSFTLDDVGLQYPGAERPVLSHISMTLSPRKVCAIIGSTGSGKSSIVRLFPRLIDATSGQVRAGDIPVTDCDLTDLRRRIAVVPQKAFLFSGTVASNVAGVVSPDTPVDRERVETALKAAQAWDFVSDHAEDIDTRVESGGKNFSGGQRQRLTIARAIYRCLPDDGGRHGADLIIFDDSFSALDYATDARLRAALHEYIGDIAILIIAQRVSTIRYADEIHVLEAGQIIGSGTHNELMDTCQTYQEIVSSQLSEEEAR
ncbi:ABC transporter ATP-binding protein [Trueperella sp. LYQ143]|uniref:ABC transporter ATP-binding protein n=1 Tax=Trueperella sp. LYQ143 TaxID=3391059 RepID=UPI0039833BAB